jgi:hypothetical protein
MDKKERYYNFIVDDMVKKTEIDHDQDKIVHPHFFHSPLIPLSPFFYPPFLPTDSLGLLPYKFIEHVIERYGVKGGELQIIWEQYKQRIETIINNG